MTLLVAAGFGIWAVLSVIGQFRGRFVTRLRGADPCSLLPRWTFFAPNPGTSDYYLMCRDRYRDGTIGEFEEIPLNEPRSLVHAIWNPGKLRQKALSDAMQSLPKLADDVSVPGLKTTIPYLGILNHVIHLGDSTLAVARQFVVIQAQGGLEHKVTSVAFVSDFHAFHNRTTRHREG